MTKGISANIWSGDHVERLQKMNAEGVSYQGISEALGRSVKAVKAKLAMLRMTPEKLRAFRAKKHTYYSRTYPGRQARQKGFEPIGPHPDEDVLAERNYRMGLMPRDLTAAMFGDPPPGYSALDRRAQQ